jgi:hypothetical protein
VVLRKKGGRKCAKVGGKGSKSWGSKCRKWEKTELSQWGVSVESGREEKKGVEV